MPRLITALLVAALLGAAPARAADPPRDPLSRAVPEAVGLSAARLARIEQLLREEIERGRLPGAVIAIARHGRLAYYEAFGFLDAAARTPMPRDAIFPIASMTKPMTGVAALMLLEEGRLTLADPVARLLPELANQRVAADPDTPAGAELRTVAPERPMTVQDLMRHTSGLTYGGRGATALHPLYPAGSVAAAMEMDGAALLARLAAAPLRFQPGTTWEYGFSTDVLGFVVERVSQQPLEGFLGERVFRPLGMRDTGFVVPEDQSARLARPLAREPDTDEAQVVPVGTRRPRFACGGGCAVSTAADYLRFAEMLRQGGTLEGTRLLGRKTVEAMTSDQLAPAMRNRVLGTDPMIAGWGFGLTVAVRTAPGGSQVLGSVGDFTWAGAYGTNFWVDPHEGLSVVFMAQTPGALRLHYRRVINALVLQAIED